MHTSKRQRSDRSQSTQLHDDIFTVEEVTKKPLSRKEQNRICQEKSRARKAEHASLLEAELRLVKYSPDAQVSALLQTIQVLLHENARLRSLVGVLSSFIGSGLGGLVARVGLTEEGVQATASEGYYDLLKREATHIDATAQAKQAEVTASRSTKTSSASSSNHWLNHTSSSSDCSSRSSDVSRSASAQISVTEPGRPTNGSETDEIRCLTQSKASQIMSTSSAAIDPTLLNQAPNMGSALFYPPDMLPTISPTDTLTISNTSHKLAMGSGHNFLPLELDLDVPVFNTTFLSHENPR